MNLKLSRSDNFCDIKYQPTYQAILWSVWITTHMKQYVLWSNNHNPINKQDVVIDEVVQ